MLNSSRFENEDYKATIFKGKDFEIFNVKSKKTFCPNIKKHGTSFLLDFENLPLISEENAFEITKGILKAKAFIKEIKRKGKDN